ncbi:FliM/FliN family flagellar motor switch protein [Fulvimarina sp. MAC8]|uniref:FliM/FliN family flagellar motor switch protein n=1 Tax=Fulvimarina sp. MAC8 TaxID=3162874 RepID=UPI0032EF271A
MSDTRNATGSSDIGERLKSAAEIDPSKLYRLIALAEETAEELTLGLNGLSVNKLAVSFREFEIGRGAENAGDDEDGVIFGVLNSKRFARPAYLVAPNALADVCISAFFGAAPAGTPGQRALTDLDRSLVRTTFETLVESFASSFAPIDRAAFEAGGLIKREDLDELLGGENAGRYLAIGFDIFRAADKAAAKNEAEPITTLTMALPVSYLAPHRRILSEPVPTPQPSLDETWSEAMVRNFEKSGLHLEAVLARKKVPLSDVARFRVGQTIPLDVLVSEMITLECEGKPVFKSQVGFSRGSYVARFEEAIEPTQEFIDDILSD